MRAIRLVKKQLIIFWSAALVATVVLGVVYLRVPDAMGINRYYVEVDLDRAANLYEGAEVTYLGKPVGRVETISLNSDSITVKTKLDDEFKIPGNVNAEVHSRSAVGEQYLEFVPNGDVEVAPLRDGDSIPVARTSVPVEIGPVLDNVRALAASVDARNLNVLLYESGISVYQRTGDLQRILDQGGDFIDLADENFEETSRLLRDVEPLLQTVNGKGAEVQELSENLAQVTRELRAGDADIRRLLREGPGFSAEARRLLDDIGTNLPPLMNNLLGITSVLVPYAGNLDSLLTEYPRAVATVQSVTIPELDDATVRLTLANINSPSECIKGFVPPQQWSAPSDPSPRRSTLVYCQESANDPRASRGARNVPCPNNPAIRTGDARRCGR